MVRRILLSIAFMTTLAVSGCSSTDMAIASAPDLLAALEGRWTNDRQVADAPVEVISAPPAPGGFWLDRRRVTFTRPPSALGDVLLATWRDETGAETARQLWRITAGKHGLELAIVTLGPGAAPDWPRSPPPCPLALTPRGPAAFDAILDVGACPVEVDGAPGWRTQRITLMPTGLLHQEMLLRADESVALRIPGGPPYEFRRP